MFIQNELQGIYQDTSHSEHQTLDLKPATNITALPPSLSVSFSWQQVYHSM
jgi:hypothetical protein